MLVERVAGWEKVGVVCGVVRSRFGGGRSFSGLRGWRVGFFVAVFRFFVVVFYGGVLV